jgi:glycosyltransferase involved in cell wall biosynthesis
LIQCEWTPYAAFLKNVRCAPILIATHNIESQILARRAAHGRNPIEKMFFRLQEWKMRRFEQRALSKAGGAIAVTLQDMNTIRSWGVKSVSLVKNGVDIGLHSEVTKKEEDHCILILSSLDWFPNVDAVDHFVKDIFPLIRERCPKSFVRIVGRRPADSLRERLSRAIGIEFVGEVDDVRPYLDGAAVVVVPLRIGGGSRLKILEALAAGKAVVSTSVGAEGLELNSGEHLLIADSPSDFAQSVCDLLNFKELQDRLRLRGREFVRRNYGWDTIAKQLEDTWYNLATRSKNGAALLTQIPEPHSDIP